MNEDDQELLIQYYAIFQCDTEYSKDLVKKLYFGSKESEKLKEEVRQLKFRLADEQDSHTHNECRKEIKRLNELLDQLGVLRGEDAKKFEEYNNRPATKKEIEHMEECVKFYKEHDHDEIELTKLKQIKQRLKDRIKFVKTKSNIHDPNCTEWDMELNMLQTLLNGDPL